MISKSRFVAGLLGLTFLGYALILFFLVADPNSSSKGLNDHTSHWGSAILFHEYGLDLYRKTSGELCSHDADPAPTRAAGRNVNDLCTIAGKPEIRPFYVNFQYYPRPYPPGAILYAAFEAFLHVKTNVSFETINRISILKYLFFACLAIFAFFQLLFQEPHGRLRTGFNILVLFWTGTELTRHALSGIHDGIAILALFLSIGYFADRKTEKGILSYAVAVFLNFRSIWYLPLVGVYLVQMFQRPRESWNHGQIQQAWVTGAIALFLGGFSAYTLYLELPAVQGYPITNPLFRSSLVSTVIARKEFALLFVGACGWLLYKRNWTSLAMISWLTWLLTNVPDVRSLLPKSNKSG